MVCIRDIVIFACAVTAGAAKQQQCGDAIISTDQATCYDDGQGGKFACGKVQGVTTLPCGSPVCYLPSKYTCYDGNQLCPVVQRVVNGTTQDLRTKACGTACYLDTEYPCLNGTLGPHLPIGNVSMVGEKRLR